MPDEQTGTVETGESQQTQESQSTNESDIWAHPTLARFKGAEGAVEHEKLAKSYVELDAMSGKRVPVPDSGASSEEWEKYVERGTPKSHTEYKLSAPGVDDVSTEELERFAQGFHKAKLHPWQAEQIMQMFTQEVVGEQKKTYQANLEQQTKTQVALKNEWGANYEANVGMVKSMLREMGGEQGEDLVGLLGGLLENNELGAKFLYETAQTMRPSLLAKGEGSGNYGLITVNEAQAEKRDILSNPENPLYNSYYAKGSYAKRKPAVDRLLELNGVIAKAQ